MWKPDIVIYHCPCDDGFGAAWAAWKRWGDTVEYVRASYGNPPPDVAGKHVLIVDFSYKRDVLREMGKAALSIIILDHHKTAEADLAEYRRFADAPYRFTLATVDLMAKDLRDNGYPPINALFDMGRSGARIAWEFCHADAGVPLLIQLIEDRDLWRFSLPDTKAFTLWLRSRETDFEEWDHIARMLEFDDRQAHVMAEARAIEAFYDQLVRRIASDPVSMPIAGIEVPTVNCPYALASDVGHRLLDRNPDAPFVACYHDTIGDRRAFSLRSSDDRMDVADIASRFGGGGHRNAAGFSIRAPYIAARPAAVTAQGDGDLRSALKMAIEHIEHMTAWIARQRNGYSFEGLGEDWGAIKAGLLSPSSPDAG